MENKNQNENAEYQFIREKVVPKRKSRLKRMCLSFLFTVFLAAVFGFVARWIFIYSDGPLRRLLGTTLELQEHETPTPEPTRTEPAATPTPRPTLVPTKVPTAVPATIPPTPTVVPEPTAVPTLPVSEEEGEASLQTDQIVEFYQSLQQLAEQVEQSLATITVSVTGIDWLNDTYETESRTTGVLLEKTQEHLLILVNLDRIQSASHISLTVGKAYYEAELWNYDKDYNLAVIEVAADGLPTEYLEGLQPAQFGESMGLAEGTPILALGNPNGYMGSMEFGMVTSTGSMYYITDNSVDLFNTDTVNSDSGDGVIANMQGEIIGIITRTLKADLNSEVCTAIGMTKLAAVVQKLAAGQERIYFGITGEDIPSSVLAEYNLNNGIYVIEVAPESPAFEAGIKTGDIILKVDEINIYSYSGFNTLLNLHRSEEIVTVTLQRTVRMSPKIMELTVVLSSK